MAAVTTRPPRADRRLAERLGAADPTRPDAGGWMARWWVALCALALVVASDYEIRTRDPDAALSGGIDGAILLELALYGIVGGYLAVVHSGPPRLRRTDAPRYLAALLVFLMALSLVYTPFPQFALVRVVQMGIVLGLTLAVAGHATRAHLHRLAHAYIVLIAGSVVLGLAVPATPVTSAQIGRFTWLSVHPVTTGVLTGIATVLVLTYLVAGRPPPGVVRWRRGHYLGALALCGGGLLATQTRGAILGVAVAAAVVLVTSRDGRRIIDAGIAASVLVTGVAIGASDTVFGYFTRGESAEKLATLNERTRLWEAAAQAVGEQPMYGHGVTAAQGIFLEETGLGGGHNALVNIAVELGLVGVICWLALVATLVAGLVRLPRSGPSAPDRSLLLGVVVFLLVDGIFFEGPAAVTNVASTWLLLAVGWLAVLRRTGPRP